MTKIRTRVLVGICALLSVAALRIDARPASSGVAWRTSLQTALQDAKRTGKPVLVDLWATWCSPCRAMDKSTYSHVSVIRESRKWVPVKIDIDDQPKIAEHFGLKTPPMVVFLKSDGSVISNFSGYVDAAAMMKQMKSAYARRAKKSAGATSGATSGAKGVEDEAN